MNVPAVLKRLSAVLLGLLLSGCGSYYTVSVDSLREDGFAADATACFLEPGNEGVSEDDLLFREVVRTLEPAFLAQGYTVVSRRSEAQSIARITYWEEEPYTTLETETIRRTEPVVLRDGKKERVEYITVEEPTVSTRTVYTMRLLVETRRCDGKQIWRTFVSCSGSAGGFRTLLASMAPVLPRTLGTRTNGTRTFEVFMEDGGKLSVEEIREGTWW